MPREFAREGSVAVQFAELAAGRASGSLVVNEHPGGVAHFADGFLVFAESPEIPDLGARLVHSGRVPAHRWDQVTAQSGSGLAVADLLVGYGLVTSAELRYLLQSISLDALLALAVPLAGSGFQARATFVPGPPHWAGSVLRMDVGQAWGWVEQEAARGGLAKSGVTPGTRPVLRDLDRPSAVLTRWEWIIACQATGDVTVSELAWRTGLSLRETAHWAGKLIQAGLCAPAPTGPPDQPVPPPATGEEDPAPSPDGGLSPMPRRVPGAMLPAGRDAATGRVDPPAGYPDAGITQSPDLPLLRQILNGLRSLR